MRAPRLSRRKLLLGAATAGAAAAAGAFYRAWPSGPMPSPRVEKFARPLPVPPVLAPSRSDADIDYYEMTQRTARAEIVPGMSTAIWGYNGIFPGPTIRARAGRCTVVRQINQLAIPTVVHLHGGVTPADSDGFPTDLSVPDDFPRDVPICSALPTLAEFVRSGATLPPATKLHSYPNKQRAATLWYHDHAMDFAGRNIYHGLAGFYLISDDEERALNLPDGPYDIPLMICLRRFAPDGSMAYDDRGHLGAQGDVVLVNGAPWPRLAVERRKYRLRILNASNATPLTLALDSGRPMAQIATDAGLLPGTIRLDRIPLAMGERVEVVIDFADYPAATRVLLQDCEALEGRQGASPSSAIMCFDVVERKTADTSALPEHLTTMERLAAASGMRIRDFDLAADFALTLNLPPISWDINGRKFDPDRVDADPILNDTEIWHFRHRATMFPGRHVHPAHIHLAHFQILERNGAPPPPHERGWKDTVRLEQGDDVRVAARFTDHRGRYILHCHNLEHEDHSMMARFDVV